MGTVAKRIVVDGTVTGVGFRYSTRREAEQFPNLRGCVRNASARRVECILQGEDTDVAAMVAWLRHGPPGARVTDITVIELAVDATRSPFRIVL